MKLINLLTLLIFSATCFSQTYNSERTQQIAEIEKKFYSKTVQNFSVASNNINVYYYRCNWKVDPAVRFISGSVTSYFQTTSAAIYIRYDCAAALTVDSVLYHNKKTSFSQDASGYLQINFTNSLPVNTKDSLSVFYHGVPPDDGNYNGAFVLSKHGTGIPLLWTLSEPYGASAWWPCKNDLTDKADSIDIFITHPSTYKSSSNGVLINETTTGSLTTAHYKHRYPIAAYLVGIAITNYSVYTTSVVLNGNTVPVTQYIYPENLQDFKNRSYIFLNALQLYSKYFGVYPFYKERYGQTQFNYGGGMEHQTNSFVTNTGEDLMTHELGHQWFGDKVTCASWSDIWLNEGFATWLADLFYTEKIDTALYKTYVTGDLNNIVSQPGGSVYVSSTDNFYRIFDNRLTYHKGAFLLRMLRFTLGDSNFFKGINAYLNDPKLAYGFAHTADLQRNLEATSGQDLNYFFNQWFYGQGFPTFTVYWFQNALSNKLTFKVHQTSSMPSSVPFFKVKLPVQVQSASQSKTFFLQCDSNDQMFTIDNPGFKISAVSVDADKYLISANNITARFIPSINISTPPKRRIIVSPNPVKNIATVSLNNLSGKIVLKLFNANGNIVWNKTLYVASSSNQTQIPFSNFINGIYKLNVFEENGTQTAVTIVK